MPPTAAEDSAIQVGIAADPVTYGLTAADMARMLPLRRVGRPKLDGPRELMTMRVHADVLLSTTSTGDGWQTLASASQCAAARGG